MKWNPSCTSPFISQPFFFHCSERGSAELWFGRQRGPQSIQSIKGVWLTFLFNLYVSVGTDYGAVGVNDRTKRVDKRLNDRSTAPEWHAANTVEYKDRTHVSPREKLWFIYKLLGSVLSNSQTRVVHACVVSKWKKLLEETELSSPAFLPDKRHLICTQLSLSLPSPIRQSSFSSWDVMLCVHTSGFKSSARLIILKWCSRHRRLRRCFHL